VDPRALSVMWDVQTNIGGKGTPAERLAMLNAVAAKQEAILAPAVAQGQLDTPIVGLPEYRNTLARMCETAGISDVVSYFKELPPGWQPPPPPPPQPSTEQVLAQVEEGKLQAQSLDDARSSQTDRLKIAFEDDRSRAEAAVTAWVQAYVAATKGGGLPMPSIDEFKQALRGNVPLQALFAQPQPPPPPQQGAPPGAAGPPPAALGAPLPGGPARPAGPPPQGGPPPALGPAAPDPAAVMAMRRAMLQRGGPNAGQMLVDRAVMPQPPGQS
jgi:hypothetical protein